MDFIKRTKDWGNVAREAYKAQKKRKEYEEIEKNLLKKLKELSEFESSEANGFRFQKTERKGVIKYSAIPELKDIDLELDRSDTTSCSWRLFKY